MPGQRGDDRAVDRPAPVRRQAGVRRRTDQRVREDDPVGRGPDQPGRLGQRQGTGIEVEDQRPAEDHAQVPCRRLDQREQAWSPPTRPPSRAGRTPPRAPPARGGVRPRSPRRPGLRLGRRPGELDDGQRVSAGRPMDPRRPVGGTRAVSADRSRSAVPAWSSPVIARTGRSAARSGLGSPSRRAATTRIGSATSRRAANTRASAEGRSRWCASSRRMASGWRSARRVITPSVAAPTANRSGGGPVSRAKRGPQRRGLRGVAGRPGRLSRRP